MSEELRWARVVKKNAYDQRPATAFHTVDGYGYEIMSLLSKLILLQIT